MAAATDDTVVLAYLTCASQEEAERIGRTLVAERHAACVNILPGMRSLYWWQGELTASAEAVLIAKTTTACSAALSARVLALHSYSCPCVVLLPVSGGNPAYLAWLAGEVRAGQLAPGAATLSPGAGRRDPPTGAPPPG